MKNTVQEFLKTLLAMAPVDTGRASRTRLFSILILINLCLGTGLTWVEAATAAPNTQASYELAKKDRQGDRRNDDRKDDDDDDDDDDREGNREGNRLSPSRTNELRRDLARRLGIAPGKVKVVETRRQTWPNACLGLPRSGEGCGQAQVRGWRVVLSANGRTWVYRTDLRVQIYRLETEVVSNPGGGELPGAIATTVLQTAARQLRVEVSSLRIVRAERQTWPNGCLGLSEPDTLCTQALISGWRVVVSGRERQLVYRTNESGSIIKLDRAASRLGDAELNRVQLDARQLPPLPQNVIFRAISSGGIAGRTYETQLFRDGRLVRLFQTPIGNSAQPEVRRLSMDQVNQFQRVLQQQDFQRFNGWSYQAPSGAADFITVTVSTTAGTVQYADIVQNRLPEPLQAVIRTWSQWL